MAKSDGFQGTLPQVVSVKKWKQPIHKYNAVIRIRGLVVGLDDLAGPVII